MNKMNKLKKAFALFNVILITSVIFPSLAGATTFNFEGVLTNVIENGTDSSITEGTIFWGTLVFDETTPDSWDNTPGDYYGNYYPDPSGLNQITVNVGRITISKKINIINVYDNKETCYGAPDCHYLDRFFVNAGDNVGPDYDMIQVTIDDYNIGLPTPIMISSDDLPKSLDLSLAEIKSIIIRTEGIDISGEVIVLSTSITETTIASILGFFDEYVGSGKIECNGQCKHPDKRLDKFRDKIVKADNLIEREKIEPACKKLQKIYDECDGEPKPKDSVKGSAVAELNDMISYLMEELGCE